MDTFLLSVISNPLILSIIIKLLFPPPRFAPFLQLVLRDRFHFTLVHFCVLIEPITLKSGFSFHPLYADADESLEF